MQGGGFMKGWPFGVLMVVTLLAFPVTMSMTPAATSVKTVKTGALTVAIDNDMPFCQEKNGSIVGVDGEVITAIAGSLGLKIEPVVMEWAAEIESVQSGRTDTNICGLAYTEERAKAMNLTQPVYYNFEEFTQLKSSNIKKMEDLKGKTLGIIQGYMEIPYLKQVPWIGEQNLKLYNTIDAGIQDVIAKRVDALMIGAISSGFLAKQHPEWNLKYEPIEPTEYLPTSKSKTRMVFSARKDNMALVQAMNDEIARMKANGTIAKILAKYGMDNPAFLKE